MKKFVLTGIAMGVFALSAFAALTSGLGKGEQVVPFHPDHISGPLANTSNCFPCTFQNRPQTQVWVNGDSLENVAKIAQTLDAAMAKYSKNEFKAMIVFLATPAKVAETKANLKAHLAKTNFKNIDVAVLATNHEAVGDYKINLKAKNTVFVYRNWKVANKMVDLKADQAGLASLDAAISQIVK